MKRTILFLISFLLFTTFAQAGEISFGLEDYLRDFPNEETTKVIVRMDAQVDIEHLDNQLRRMNATTQHRHEVVVTALREMAEATQGDILRYLEQHKNQGNIIRYKPFWIVNIIAVEANRDIIFQLAEREDVDLVYPDLPISLIEPVEHNTFDPGSRGTEPGLRVINADKVWEMGYNGSSVLIADNDTGADGNHPAFGNRWRGHEAPWQECWLDVLDGGTQFPADNGGHGTHTLGTMCGITPGDTIGVAWGAKWIASNTIDQSVNPGFDSDVIETFEWMADPDGNPQTIDDVPDVINNSWGVYESMSGYIDCDPRYNEVITNCEAASVIVVFAAGNEGDSGLRSPSDQILSYTEVFSVGAVDGNVTGPPWPITGFSSKGPSHCIGPVDLLIKPEVSAPGNNVRSSMPGGGYGTMSGTSMACPHTAGVLALMRDINPNLDVQLAKQILMDTAIDHGVPGEDNIYGWGVIDAYEAALMTIATMSSFEGYVYDGETGESMGAEVYIPGQVSRASADEETGFYHLGVMPDTTDGYQVYAKYFGYYTSISDVYYIDEEDTIDLNINMYPLPSGYLIGHVTDTDGNPLPNAKLKTNGLPVDAVFADGQGYYEYDLAGDYTYLIDVSAADHDSMSFEVYVGADSTTTFNIELAFIQSFESTDGGFTLEGTFTNEWEWGTPTEEGGPPSAYMGNNVWGTDLNNLYETNANWNIVSPYYEITSLDSVILKFFTWYDMTEGWDGGNVQFRSNTDTIWTIVSPVGDYPDNSVIALSGKPGFTGNSMGWIQHQFNLNNYIGHEKLQYRFHFSSTNTHERGWFIDNIIMYGVNSNPFLAPYNLQASLENQGNYANIYLTWDPPNSSNITMYHLYRRLEGEEYGEPLQMIAPENTEYTDIISDNSTYYYMLTAAYGENESPQSNEVMIQWTTGINNNLIANIPNQYQLYQNHPNPFNPTTLIQYALPEKAKISLKIYDTGGKLVRNLAKGSKEAGYHSLTWKGIDDTGKKVTSGIYILKLYSKSFSDTQKMILLK